MEGTLQQNPQNLGSILESDAGDDFMYDSLILNVCPSYIRKVNI